MVSTAMAPSVICSKRVAGMPANVSNRHPVACKLSLAGRKIGVGMAWAGADQMNATSIRTVSKFFMAPYLRIASFNTNQLLVTNCE